MGVTAVGVDVACADSKHQVVPMSPNMCITPAAPSPLPMPYPIFGDTGSLDGCDDTKIESKASMNLSSEVKSIKGNTPGTQKDVVTMKTEGKAFALVGAPVVHFEGSMCVITGSPGFMNTM